MTKKQNYSDITSELIGQPMFGILKRAKQLQMEGVDVIHFELGDPDFNAPKNVVDAVGNALEKNLTHYTNSRGLPGFIDAIQKILLLNMNIDCDINQIVVTPGANSGIYWTIRCLVNPNEEVLIPDPGFPSFSSAAKAAGVISKYYSCREKNNFLPDLEEIEALITNKTKLIILNSPSNPTGASIPELYLKKIYNLADKNNLYILSDDTYRGMSFLNEIPPSIASIDNCKKRTICLSGLSKEYSLSGFRLGYLVGPEMIIDKISLYIETVVSCVPPFTQFAGIEALLGDQSEKINNLKEIAFRKNFFVDRLNSIPGIQCFNPDSGLYVFPSLENLGIRGDEFAKLLLEEAGIASVPGSSFGNIAKYNVRFSLNNNIETIDKAINRIKNLIT